MLFGELVCHILHRWTEMSLWGRCRGTCTRSRKWKSSQPWENSERRWGSLTADVMFFLFSPHRFMDDSEACAPESHVLLKLHRHMTWQTEQLLQQASEASRLKLTMHLFWFCFVTAHCRGWDLPHWKYHSYSEPVWKSDPKPRWA